MRYENTREPSQLDLKEDGNMMYLASESLANNINQQQDKDNSNRKRVTKLQTTRIDEIINQQNPPLSYK